MHHLQANKIITNSISSLPWEPQQVELYAQIQAFEIDQPFTALPFSRRLARDHQWSLIYTERVIEEYKKFLFLAIVANHLVTPSNAVDQVWHLHLTYTHSYWNDLCNHILPRPLHHHPTQGGQQQQELFWDCYRKTLDSYEHFFGDRAPVDIWSAPATRFRQAGQFRQINSEDYWVIPKPSFAPFQRVFWQIFHLSWLRNGMISLMTIGLIFSLNFLDYSAISANVDLTNVSTTQPAASQISSSLNHDISPNSEVKPAQDFGWIWWVIGCFLVSGFIVNWISSWCPVCKRPWLVETTTRVLREPTEQVEGEQLVTRRCECCQYTQERYEAVFKEPDSDFGCGCGI